MQTIVLRSKQIQRLSFKQDCKILLRRYGGSNDMPPLLMLGIGGAFIGGCIGLTSCPEDPGLALVMGMGGSIIGFVFVPSLIVPQFWPMYALILAVVLLAYTRS